MVYTSYLCDDLEWVTSDTKTLVIFMETGIKINKYSNMESLFLNKLSSNESSTSIKKFDFKL